MPHDIEARLFFRSAKERLEDADVLYDAEPKRTTGTVYLAGYSVECALKALILASEPASRHEETLDSFRGAKAHSFDWLREQYQLRTGQVFPQDIRFITFGITDYKVYALGVQLLHPAAQPRDVL